MTIDNPTTAQPDTPAPAAARLPEYRAGQVPEGLATRSQLRRLGLSPAGLPRVAWLYLMYYHQWVELFEIAQARPKRPLTDRQREVLAHGRMLNRTEPCRNACGTRVSRWYNGPGAGWCEPCRTARQRARWQAHQQFLADARRDAATWAAKVLVDPTAVILDAETTGLEDAYAVEVSVLEVASGRLLFDSLLHPGMPIPPDATAIHGISDEMVADAPRFPAVADQLAAALAGRTIVIYNVAFDTDILTNEAARHPAAAGWVADVATRAECAMEQHAAWHGDWHDYFRSFTWQKLNGGHRAAGDCRAVVRRLREMAAVLDSEPAP